MKQTVLNQILQKHHRQAGLKLMEDDHCVYLMWENQKLAIFNSTKVTIKQIWEVADRLVEKYGR